MLNLQQNLQQILGHFPTTSTEDLHLILNAIQIELSDRKNNSSEYVQYIEDLCDSELLENIQTECKSLKLISKGTKTASQWISCRDEPYIYNDSNPVHKAMDMKDFPHISKLAGLINESNAITGPLDSCLVLKYNSNKAVLRAHSDSEAGIDQRKSICSFSIGSERTIEFWDKSKKTKLVKEIRMANNSLVVMRPGAQQRLLHSVRAEPGNLPSQVRYSLSFRAINTDQGDIQQPGPGKDDKKETPRKRVCLIAGDSYAARMDISKLAKGKITVDTVAEGGAKISKVKKQLEDYRASHPNHDVMKIIVSVGTNDIRYCENGVEHLSGPFKDLCNTIRKLYPNSSVFFQSLLPLPNKDVNDWKTNKRVLNFNRLIWNACVYMRFYFIDAFFPFCKYNRRYNQPHSRFDKLFEVNGIHPNREIGMGVLARMYIRALHSKYFDPNTFQ